jgi:TetR/AcrR family transcriptional regulator, regulator of autoinduction and epiphytic fitness
VTPDTGTRDARKARTHRALLDAALSLTRQRGPGGLTVDAVAELAGVSRRTVFYHFATLDEIVLAACTEVLDVLVDGFLAEAAAALPGDPSPAAAFDDVVRALRATDLVGPMAYLTHALGSHDPHDPRARAFVDSAFGRCTEHLLAEVTRRYPTVDPFDLELAVSSLLSGVVVIPGRWWARTDAADDAASRAVWAELLDRLVTTLRSGFGR